MLALGKLGSKALTFRRISERKFECSLEGGFFQTASERTWVIALASKMTLWPLMELTTRVNNRRKSNPNAGCIILRHPLQPPSGLQTIRVAKPKVGLSAQPWAAGGYKDSGPMELHSHPLPQNSVGNVQFARIALSTVAVHPLGSLRG
jgi:hypothetical protein